MSPVGCVATEHSLLHGKIVFVSMGCGSVVVVEANWGSVLHAHLGWVWWALVDGVVVLGVVVAWPGLL